MKLMMLLIISFTFSAHPISMILTMIFLALTLNMYMYMYMKYTWFIMMITLLILGGLLVTFFYITSLTPNKKFTFKKKVLIAIPLLFFLKNNQVMESTFDKQINTLIQINSLTIQIFTLTYLMLTLLTINHMIKSNMAPLKIN
uniref:NADH dehydrogenase subunit 6 n=1 Tax=Alectorobius peropteryx TaxID=1265610 RepID=UPI00223907B6|nr:NADH dehydrogenase subunit 6 [Alectorobius peropteryx]UYB78506.1 NADH dehydrogenase subunit 6 [Alectorobius peropteryx]UYB78519.1 NADH dehydrogenase subunit 6 [Alectorobius peropteryx]